MNILFTDDEIAIREIIVSKLVSLFLNIEYLFIFFYISSMFSNYVYNMLILINNKKWVYL